LTTHIRAAADLVVPRVISIASTKGHPMSSLARRTLRATAAIAGITVAGVGLVGPALAAPAAPERPNADGVAPAPDAGSTPNLLGEPRQPTPETADLPQLFTVEDTGVHTSDHALPAPEQLPAEQPPRADDVVDIEDTRQLRNTDVEFRTAAQDRGSAMQELDAASMFGDVPDRLLGATEGNDIHT
jgi:hypothetical protein